MVSESRMCFTEQSLSVLAAWWHCVKVPHDVCTQINDRYLHGQAAHPLVTNHTAAHTISFNIYWPLRFHHSQPSLVRVTWDSYPHFYIYTKHVCVPSIVVFTWRWEASLLINVQGIKPRSSDLAVCTLAHWTISIVIPTFQIRKLRHSEILKTAVVSYTEVSGTFRI